jgi:PAS domain S-box-containing protein
MPDPFSDDPGRTYEELMREALLGAGTSVWQWDISTDRLSGVDGGMALLGFGPSDLDRNQQAWNTVIHPEDLSENDASYLRHARGETPIHENEYRARHKDGRWIWISERGRIVARDAQGAPLRMVGTLTDISERRRTEGHLLELAERWLKISRHVPGIVYQFRRGPDGSGHFPYVSESCEKLFGLSPQVLMTDATAFLRLIERDDRERVLQTIDESARRLAPWRCEFRLDMRKGPERWMTGASTPQLEPDGGLLWHGYIEETTELHRLEQVRQAAAAAQAANAAKTDFLSRVSHELRTPLNAVLGFAQLLEIDEREPLTPNQAKRVAMIRDAGGHLLKMIGELLDLTSIEAGKLALSLGEVDLGPLLGDCVELVRPQADAAGLRIECGKSDTALLVRADPLRLRQVVLNLLSNAVKYNRPGGLVRVQVRGAGAQVVFDVVDTGVGITQADLPRLFEPFDRLAQQHGSIQGTGIGLAMTRGLVGLMHGRIDVVSQAGAGSTFSVTLPAA